MGTAGEGRGAGGVVFLREPRGLRAVWLFLLAALPPPQLRPREWARPRCLGPGRVARLHTKCGGCRRGVDTPYPASGTEQTLPVCRPAARAGPLSGMYCTAPPGQPGHLGGGGRWHHRTKGYISPVAPGGCPPPRSDRTPPPHGHFSAVSFKNRDSACAHHAVPSRAIMAS